MQKQRKVTILQDRLTHYRVAFFEYSRNVLSARGVELHLVHGQASPSEVLKKDEGTVDWADRVVNRFCRVGGKDLLCQPFPKSLRDSDLIVITQENRILSNYPFLFRRKYFNSRIAYWGHGRNHQSTATQGLRERWKRTLLCSADWWFAYTKCTVDYLIAQGFPENRITCLNNAIDTSRFRQELQGVPDSVISSLRMELKLDKGSPVGLYCGSLYQEKRLDLMVAAADIIRRHLKDFSLVVIGDGPSAADLQVTFANRPWAHWIAPKKGIEKAAYFRLADVVLNPGLVGLHVLDAFCAGLPMITTATAMHSPEVAYLENGINGIIAGDDPDEYAAAVVQLLSDQEHYRKLSEAALSASKLYTVEEMANRFADGIYSCLQVAK